MLHIRHVGRTGGYAGSGRFGNADICRHSRDLFRDSAFAGDGFFPGAVHFPGRHRNGDHLQYGKQLFPGSGFVCDQSAGSGITAGRYHGLFHFPVAQLRRTEALQ